jgi:hypothetical protein
MIVEQFARIGVGEERVDGEVAAARILFPVFGKGDRRATAIG